MMVHTILSDIQAAQRFHRSAEMVMVIVPFGMVGLPVDTYSRLDEWSRWARPRIGLDSHGRCASAEGRYDSVYPDASRSTSPILVDLPAVLAVERVVTRMPNLSREITRRYFVCRDAPHAITRSLGIHKGQFGAELRSSVMMVKNMLTRNLKYE